MCSDIFLNAVLKILRTVIGNRLSVAEKDVNSFSPEKNFLFFSKNIDIV